MQTGDTALISAINEMIGRLECHRRLIPSQLPKPSYLDKACVHITYAMDKVHGNLRCRTANPNNPGYYDPRMKHFHLICIEILAARAEAHYKRMNSAVVPTEESNRLADIYLNEHRVLMAIHTMLEIIIGSHEMEAFDCCDATGFPEAKWEDWILKEEPAHA